MNKFIIKTIFFFLPIIFLAGAIENRITKNSFYAKSNLLNNNSNNIEVMFLGSSHSWRAINPKYFDFSTAPLAHGGSAFNIDYLLFKKYYEKLPKLKVLLIELSYHTLEESRDENWTKNHLFYHYYGINNYNGHPPIKDLSLITAYPKQYLKYCFGEGKSVEWGPYNDFGFIELPDSSGTFASYSFDTVQINTTSIDRIKYRHRSIDTLLFTQNKNKLIDIINICRQKKIKVVLISPPKYITYNQNMVEEKLERRNKLIRELTTSKNVEFWNYEYTFQNQVRMFGNDDHLNPYGAKIFTRIINTRIKKTLLEN